MKIFFYDYFNFVRQNNEMETNEEKVNSKNN